MNHKSHNKLMLGLNERALSKMLIWPARFEAAKELGFDFMEIAINDRPERISRLGWTRQQKLDFIEAKFDNEIIVPNLSVSTYKKYPLGSQENDIRQYNLNFFNNAFNFAKDIGISNVELLGYAHNDDKDYHAYFADDLFQLAERAAQNQIMFSVVINNVNPQWLTLVKKFNNPWFSLSLTIDHLISDKKNILENLPDILPHITLVRFNNTLPVIDDNAPSSPHLDESGLEYIDFFKALKRHQYQGSILINMRTQEDGNDMGRIEETKSWLMEKMKSAQAN